MTKCLIVPGSARRDSLNKKLGRVAAACAAEAGLEPTFADLADFAMPLYDGDLEAESGLPANAVRLRELMTSHPAWVLVSPEYNSAITPVLKNALDWASRPAPGEKSLAAYQGKTAALLSASPGALGGLRGLYQLRMILSNVNVLVIPEQFALSAAHEAFDDTGALKNPAHRATVLRVVQRPAAVAR